MAHFPVRISVEAKFEVLGKLHRAHASHCCSFCHASRTTQHRNFTLASLFRSFFCIDAVARARCFAPFPCLNTCLVASSYSSLGLAPVYKVLASPQTMSRKLMLESWQPKHPHYTLLEASRPPQRFDWPAALRFSGFGCYF
jgi:hypothetical protein